MLCFGSSASSTAPNRTDTGFVDLEKFPEGTLAVEMTPIEYGSHGSIRIIATPTNPEHPTRLQYTAKYWTLIAGDIAHVPALESVLDRGDNTWTLYPVGRPAHPKQSGGESSSPAMSFMAGLSSLLTTGIASVGKNVRVEVTVEVPAALLVNSGVMPQYASRVIGTNHSIEYAVQRRGLHHGRRVGDGRRQHLGTHHQRVRDVRRAHCRQRRIRGCDYYQRCDPRSCVGASIVGRDRAHHQRGREHGPDRGLPRGKRRGTVEQRVDFRRTRFRFHFAKVLAGRR
ncbi:hypothetical protein BC828DRAFT_179149 [Blastocladiella britannica]|nr:hypothetical protein BC828DRAFT_179149 [Blastocladiella britannica]